MSIALHWFLPTAGDSRDVVAATADAHRRDPELDYLRQVAQAAERLGFEAVLTPTGTWCEESWVSTAALISETERLKFLIAFRPGSITPTLAAQMAGTFQRHSNGRALLNIVTGGDPGEQQRFGDWLDHDERYDRTGEFLDAIPEATVDQAQSQLGKSQSVGQLRMQSLHGGRREHLVVSPNLWAGIGLVRGGAGTALVGSHDEVAERITEYHELGFDEFILSGHPHLEEAYAFGEGVTPILRRAGLVPQPERGSGGGQSDAMIPIAAR